MQGLDLSNVGYIKSYIKQNKIDNNHHILSTELYARDHARHSTNYISFSSHSNSRDASCSLILQMKTLRTQEIKLFPDKFN